MHVSAGNQKVLVIGLGVSGRAAARFLLRRGAQVWGTDQNREHLYNNAEILKLKGEGLQALHESDPLDMAGFHQVVVSPGVPPSNPIYSKAEQAGLEIIGEVELACRSLTQPCVAITGSNGKTTTTLLVTHVLNHAGYPARAVGNVGVPLTRALDEVEKNCGKDIIVLELSSWQLETLQSRVIDAGVVLNITPNHLDRHGTMEGYARAKLNMYRALKPGKPLFLGIECYRAFGPLLDDFKVKTFGYAPECDIYCDKLQVFADGHPVFTLPSEYKGRVLHDVENMMAAFALCRVMGVNGTQFAQALPSFIKPPHRIQFVCRTRGVSYYDDSKGTSLDAVAKAVQSMQGPTYLIAGGMHKGAAYTPWITAFGEKVKCVCAIGQAARQIKEDIGHTVPVEMFSSLEEAILYASEQAQHGENVLLSPGCSSYDMFRDYEHRGDEFQRIVQTKLTKGK